jgi:hypothetical protein
MTTLRSLALLGLVVSSTSVGCGGSNETPRHPVQEMTARSASKLDLVGLVVSDPVRAARVRQVYVQLAELGREYDLMRAQSLAKAGADWQRRTQQAPDEAAKPETLELVLAPPLEDSKAIYTRYAALMVEVRSLLTRAEFEKLDKVR